MPQLETTSNPLRKRWLLIFTLLFLVATLTIGVSLTFFGSQVFAGTRPNNLGLHSGQLAPCPSTSNCVHSQSLDAKHQIAPLTYKSSAPEAFDRLKSVIQSFSQSKIITETANYLYAEFTIPVFGFVDDVEFFIEPNHTIQVRSASRLGESDLGVNRKRIETIRDKFNQVEGNNVD